LIRITGISEERLNRLLESGYNAACYCYSELSGQTIHIEQDNDPGMTMT